MQIKKGLTFKGYAESLPEIGSKVDSIHQIAETAAAFMAANMSPGLVFMFMVTPF